MFPRLRKVAKQTAKLKQDPKLWLNRHELLIELHKACEIAEVEGTVTLHQFRHGSATWLVTPIDDGGMGYQSSQVFTNFGHVDDKQIQQTYGRLDKEVKANKFRDYVSELMPN